MRGPRTAMKSGPRLPRLEKALAQNRRPNTAINKIKKKKIVRGRCDYEKQERTGPHGACFDDGGRGHEPRKACGP